MAEGGKDLQQISDQLASMHLNIMDQSDDYV